MKKLRSPTTEIGQLHCITEGSIDLIFISENCNFWPSICYKKLRNWIHKRSKMYSMSRVTRYMMKIMLHHSQNWTALV